MSHNILTLKSVDNKNNALLRYAWSASALDNGWVGNLQSQSSVTGYKEVWDFTQPTTGSLLGLWIAAEPEVVITDSKYGNINPDVRDFEISASKVFTARKLVPGDIIEITADGLNDATVQAFANAAATNYEFTWADAPAGTAAMSLRYISTEYVPVASGSAMGDSRIPSYKFEVLYN